MQRPGTPTSIDSVIVLGLDRCRTSFESNLRPRAATGRHTVALGGNDRRSEAEWDAKIVEQYPDRLISWVSEDGKKTRGTVTFEPRSDSRTLIRLSMGYQAGRAIEAVGSDTRLGAWRVRGDLERFKELIEGRGAETGARQGEASAGTIKQ